MELKPLGKILVASTIALSTAPNGLSAENHAFVGARATGMGGANAASVNDTTAQWHNPAAFGFMNQSAFTNGVDNAGLSDQTFGWNVFGFGAGYTMTDDMGRYLDILADTDFDAFDSANLSNNPESVSSLLKLGSSLYGISGESLYADYTAGSSFRFGHFGVGIRMFGEVAAWVNDLDTDNLGLEQGSGAALAADINTAAVVDGFVPGAYTINTLSAAQESSLLAKLNNDTDAVKYLDFKLTQLKANGTLDQSDVNNAVTLLTEIDLDGSGSFDNNLTTVIGLGFNVIEIPFSYGHALNENLSIGVTAKGMYGSVLGTKIWLFNEDNVDEAIDNASDNQEDTLTLGLDAGVLYRIPNFQFAFVGHNLNRPSFDGFKETITIKDNMGTVLATETVKVPDVKIDPQFTLGAAFIPSERLTLGADLELLETGTLLDGYDIQRLSFGGEFDVWLLALRLGAYKNIAENKEDWVATAGVGVNLAGVRFDLAGAMSLGDDAEFDGNDIPTVARFYAGISLDY